MHDRRREKRQKVIIGRLEEGIGGLDSRNARHCTEYIIIIPTPIEPKAMRDICVNTGEKPSGEEKTSI